MRAATYEADMDPGQLLSGLTRETTIRRDAQGRWFHDGTPLEHTGLTRAFDRWVERADDGRYCLKNDINWAYITLEGPPYLVRSLQITPAGQVTLLLSNDSSEPLRPETLRMGEDGALYCDVGDGTLPARFDRHAATLLEPLISEDEHGLYVEIAGQRVRPKVAEDPLAPRRETAS
jgi:uncharacterized protein